MGSEVILGPRSLPTGGSQLDFITLGHKEEQLRPGAKVFNSYFSRLRGERLVYEIQYGLNETTLTVDDGKGYYCEGVIRNSGI